MKSRALSNSAVHSGWVVISGVWHTIKVMRPYAVRNQVQLITYPDSLGHNLTGLRHILETYLKDAIGGIHILPFYPSSADRGFAPLTHLAVDSRFGDWEDIRSIGSMYDLMADLTVNHISCESPYFKDYLEKGDRSKYADLFLDVDTFLLRHGAVYDALLDTHRPRPALPYTEFRFQDGVTRKIWTTFTKDQVDLDVTQEATRKLMKRFIGRLIENNVKIIRLDAVGYAVKKPWTKSFLIPETYEFMRWIRSTVPQHVSVLAEVHHGHRERMTILDEGVADYIYDFSLPMLVLHALYKGNVEALENWITIRPSRQFTTLDTHDGIGVVDVEGLMAPQDISFTLEKLREYGGNALDRASGRNAENVDIYQMNTTYYSALGEDDDAYITARAIQFLIPGIPQVYYVGLLAGANDVALLERTGNGRDINRHGYTLGEFKDAFGKSVVRRLTRLMRLRNSHPAFHGMFTQERVSDTTLILRWELDDLYLEGVVDVHNKRVNLEYVDPFTGRVKIQTC